MPHRWTVPVLSLLASEAFAAAPDPCALISRPAIEAATQAQVISTRVVETDLERSCVITLQAGQTKGVVRLAIFKQAPPTLESGMSLQPLDKLLPVSAIGDEAVINTNSNELKYRLGSTWYQIRTHAAPCAGDTQNADDNTRSACAAQRNQTLTALAQAAAQGSARGTSGP